MLDKQQVLDGLRFLRDRYGPTSVDPVMQKPVRAAIALLEQDAMAAGDQLRPNVMRCAKCKLRVTGAVESAPCPNGCGPLWSATWKDECLLAEARGLPPLTPQLSEILGRPNFACHHVARILRSKGMEIPTRAEAAQAAVIHFMLDLYLKHGDSWPEVANATLNATAKEPAGGR